MNSAGDGAKERYGAPSGATLALMEGKGYTLGQKTGGRAAGRFDAAQTEMVSGASLLNPK